MNIFIGSSTEKKEILQDISAIVESCKCTPIPWYRPGVMAANTYPAQRLRKIATTEVSAAILIYSTDDEVKYRNKKIMQPRDNVIFECGLFVGALGLERTAIVTSGENIKMPSDLAGITCINYNNPAKAEVEMREWIKTINVLPIYPPVLPKLKGIAKELQEKYSFLVGRWSGHTIQDCSKLKNGKKHSIFPCIAELKIEDNKIVGWAEIFYTGVGDVQYAKFALLGIPQKDKLEFHWENTDVPEHRGYISQDIITHEKFMGKFLATSSADNKETVVGEAVWYKVDCPDD